MRRLPAFARAIRLPAIALAALSALALAPCSAQAAWLKAETSRFVVYGQGDEQTVRDYAQKLTVYDQVLRTLNPVAKTHLDPQKVEVYLVGTHRELQQVMPGARSDLAGFYSASPQAIFAVATLNNAGLGVGSDETLFHEYAHHFMKENFPSAYPVWFVEGWAEYFMTTKIKPDAITVGAYNLNRVRWLMGAEWLPLSTLLTEDTWRLTPKQDAIFYAQAWDLVHYMMDDPARAQQLDKAIRAIDDGVNPVKAMEQATGRSVAQLTHDLHAYTRIHEMKFPASAFDMHPAVTVTKLSPAADDLLLVNARLEASYVGKADPEWVEEVRDLAAKHPGDRLADVTLARLEFGFGDVAKGEAIVKRRLEANPDDVEFLWLAGLGQMMAGDRDPAQRIERYRAARKLLIKAYGLNKDDFRILFQYARSRSVEPEYPNDNDVNALLAARALAPAVDDTSIQAASALVKRGRREDAKGMLQIVANDPHAGRAANWARALLAGQSLDQARSAYDARLGGAATAAAKPASGS